MKIDMIIPGSYIKHGDPIGADVGYEATNGSVRCYPCRCHTESFESEHGTSFIRKEVWIDEAMKIILDAKEWSEKEHTCVCKDGSRHDGCKEAQSSSTKLYSQVQDMRREDFEAEYDANFVNVPDCAWANGVHHNAVEITIDCGTIIPCSKCERQILCLGLPRDPEDCSLGNVSSARMIPFIYYLSAMFRNKVPDFDARQNQIICWHGQKNNYIQNQKKF